VDVGKSDSAILTLNGKTLRVTRAQASDITAMGAICIYFGVGADQAREWAQYINDRFNRVGSP
jgi:hypothetical protein